MRQEAVVRIANEESGPGIIGEESGKYVLCPVSLLFSVSAEVIMIGDSENTGDEDIAIDDIEDGIVAEGKFVRDVRFADDQEIVAGSENELRELMNKLIDNAKNFNMKSTFTKTIAVTHRVRNGVVNIARV